MRRHGCHLGTLRHGFVIGLLSAVGAVGAPPAMALDSNVVVDGGGEGVVANGTDQRIPPAWTARGGFSARAYGTAGYPDAADRDAVGGGANFLDGGTTPGAKGTQIIDLSGDAGAIGGGRVQATLSAFLGGYLSDADEVIVTASWLNGAGTDLGPRIRIGPVTAAQRGNSTELQARSGAALVPPAARAVRIDVEMTRVDGASSDGYADNVSLVLRNTAGAPPPRPPFRFAPANLGPPQVGGDPRVRQTVGCLAGLWTFDPRFTYAWAIGGAPVPGAAGQTFTIPANAKGRKLTCTVTGTTDGGSDTASSAAVEVQGKAPCLPIAGKRKCLKRGRRCKRALRDVYAQAGFECRKRRKKLVLVRAREKVLRGGAVVRYGANGLPSFKTALQAYEKLVGDLPGVKVKRGVVGDSFEGTAALGWILHYRNRLTPRQRRRVDALTGPRDVRAAGGSPAIMGYRALVPDVTRRLAAHGVVLKRGVTVQAGPKAANGDALATAYPAWLYSKTQDCIVTITAAGAKEFGKATAARDILAHELIHCAQAEQVDAAGWGARPQWVTEGGATWGGGRLALEMTGTLGPVAKDWYLSYLENPQRDLFKRDYEGIGWYQLLEHQGANVWPLLMDTQRVGSVFGAPAAYFTGLNAAFNATLLWGPTLATNSKLGDAWDLRIPGLVVTRTLLQKTISNGTTWTGHAQQRGGLAIELPLRADVISVVPGGAPVGRFRPPGEDDVPLRDAEYCVKPGGCECPDGHKLEIPEIKRGNAYLGFHGLGAAAVAVVGESLEDACNLKRGGDGINVYRLTDSGGPEPLEATFKAGKCTRGKAGWTLDARTKNKAWRLRARIGASFAGFGRRYPLIYGAADPTFRLDGPGGPYSNFAVPGSPGGGAIALSDDGKGVGFGFVPTFNADRSAGVSIAGGMPCRYPRRRR